MFIGLTNTAGVLLEVEWDEEGQLKYFIQIPCYPFQHLASVVVTVHKLFPVE